MPTKISLLSVIMLTIFLIQTASSRDLAIVVNKANPVEELSLKDLSKIFKADRQFWDGNKIHLLMRESGSWEKELILKRVYQMSEEELKKFWLGKIFRGETTSFPLVFGSTTLIKKVINDVLGAISFLDSQAIDENLKVLRIEGKLPGQEGYLLQKE